MTEVKGRLSLYTEQGWEAHFELTLEEDGKEGRDGQHVLSPGEHLIVLSEEGQVLFDGPLPVWLPQPFLWIFYREPRLPAGFWMWFERRLPAVLRVK